MGQELEEVIGWLEAGAQADYQAGVLVLQKHCKNRSLVAQLLRKESATNREKLTYELVKVGCGGRLHEVSEVLNHFAAAVQGALPSPAGTALADVAPELPAPDEVPEAVRPEVEAITELMSRLHGERVQLSNSLADLTDEATPPVVAKILSLQEQYNALAQKRRNLAAGPPAEATAESAEPTAPVLEQPAATTSPVIDRAALLVQRGNLRSNISKTRKKAEEAKSEEKRSEHQLKVAKWEAELSNVELQLALPQ